MSAQIKPIVRSLACQSCPIREHTLCSATDVRTMECLRTGTRHVTPGVDVFPQGGDCTNLYIMLSGWACLYELLEDGRRQILQFLLPGDVLGFNRHDGVATFGAQAITTVSACVVPRDRFMEAALKRPQLALELSALIAAQEAMAYEHLTSVGRRTARERVAYLLLELFCRARSRIPSDSLDQITLPLTQSHIADASGLTPVHTNRMLRNLREAGIIELNQRTLRVRNPDLLAAAAGFEREVTLPYLPHRRWILGHARAKDVDNDGMVTA